MNKIVIDCRDYSVLCNHVLHDVTRGGGVYRSVLCPLKGGFYLSHFMSRRLNLPMEYIVISSYESRERKEISVSEVPYLEAGRHIICDDVYDTGKTVEKIRSLYPHVAFDVACLVSKSPDAPGYFGRHVPPETWVEFFWETM
jgi:hypoxanthine phosphoribosyltransferase